MWVVAYIIQETPPTPALARRTINGQTEAAENAPRLEYKNAKGKIVAKPLIYRMKVACRPFNPVSANFGKANMTANKKDAANI